MSPTLYAPNAVCPAPSTRWDDAAKGTLLRRHASYVTGTLLVVDGGSTAM
jgi:hypothetical protein